MKRYALLLGVMVTSFYGYAAQAAIAADMDKVRVAVSLPTAGVDQEPIWYGGTLATVTVQAWSPQPSKISRRGQAECKAPVVRG